MVILGSILLLSMVFAPSSFIKPWKSCVLPRRSEALQFWFICRGLPGEWRDRFWWFFVRIPNLIESASMLFFLNDARIRWPKNHVTRISHTLNFGAHRSSPCGFGVFDAHFPWLADQLMLSRCGLWQAWIPRPYSFNQFNPSLRWSTRIFSTILRRVFEVYSLCKASLALGATCCAWSAEPSIAAFFGSEIQSQLIEPIPIHHIVCGNFRTSSSCQVGVFLFLTASPADFNKTIRDCPKSLSCQTNWAVFEPPVDD